MTPSRMFIRSPIWLFMKFAASQPAIPPMMMPAIQPTCCSSIAVSFYKRGQVSETILVQGTNRDRPSRQVRNLWPLAAGLPGDRRPRQLAAARLHDEGVLERIPFSLDVGRRGPLDVGR